MIRFRCPNCNALQEAPEVEAGGKRPCSDCGQRLQIPPPPSSRTILAQPEGHERWLFTQSGRPHPQPVTWEDLRAMAASGALLPADRVRQENGTRWARADSLPDLWPEVEPATGNAGSGSLTACAACGQLIAKDAPSCQGCGAANDWLHPEIARFLRHREDFDYPSLQTEGRAFVLVGRSRKRKFLHIAADVVGSMWFLGRSGAHGILTTIAAGVGREYAAQALREAAGKDGEAFLIDFRGGKPRWQSTDDEYWSDVMDFFRL